jgi:acetyl esterase
VPHPIEAGIRELVEDFIEAGCPCPSEQSIQDRRDGYLSSTVLAGASPEMHQEFVDELDGIPVKIFKPTNAVDLPITIYFHGGCFISGGFDTHTQQLRQLAKLSKSLVVCIQYRLAPESIYPGAHDDVYNAVIAVKTLGAKFGGDTSRIVFVGDSAGGQLALATSMRLRDQQNWLPCKQILIYPMLDPDGSSESYRLYGREFVITANMLRSGFDLYIGHHRDRANQELYPLNQPCLRGLPPTFIMTAEFDPLRDEGELLYKSLIRDGVEAYCERYLGVIHGFFQLSGVSQSAIRCIDNIASYIQK